MKNWLKNFYSTFISLLSIFILVGLTLYVHKNQSNLIKLSTIELKYILALMSVYCLQYLLLGLTYKIPLKKHDIHLTIREWFGLSLTSEMFNTVLPAKGGTAIRMLFLKEKKDLPMTSFLSIGFTMVVSGFTFLGLVGFLYSHYYIQKTHIIFTLMECIFISLFISGFILFFAAETFSKLFKVKRRISPKPYLKDKKILSSAIGLYALMFALYPLKIFISFKAIGIHLPLSQCLEIGLALSVSSIFQILPGNMGVKEVLTAYIAQHYGINFEAALLASLIDRAILFTFILPMGLVFYWELFLERKIPRFSTKKLNRIENNL